MNAAQYYRECNRVSLAKMLEWGVISYDVYTAGMHANGFETAQDYWDQLDAELAEEDMNGLPDFSRD